MTKPLLTISDPDVYPETKIVAPSVWKERTAARAVVLDDKNTIALLHASHHGFYKLPGGGVEKSEAIDQALQRECLEEIGCKIIIGECVGTIVEYKYEFKMRQESICYCAHIDGEKGTTNFMADEIADGFTMQWVNLDDAIELVEKSRSTVYEAPFIRLRDAKFLKEAKLILTK